MKKLADNARPIDDADYGSNRQVDAENVFFEKFRQLIGDTPEFDAYCLKATTDEIIDEALRILKANGIEGVE